MKRTFLAIVALSAILASLIFAAGGSGAPVDPLWATLNSGLVTGENRMQFGYVYHGRQVIVDKSQYAPAYPFATTVPYKADGSLVLFLRDVNCGATYYSDGSGTADHVTVETSGTTKIVYFRDSGSGCGIKRTDYAPTSTVYNAKVTVAPGTALKAGG